MIEENRKEMYMKIEKNQQEIRQDMTNIIEHNENEAKIRHEKNNETIK